MAIPDWEAAMQAVEDGIRRLQTHDMWRSDRQRNSDRNLWAHAVLIGAIAISVLTVLAVLCGCH